METVAVVNPKTPPIPKTFYYIDLESVESGILVKENIVSSDDAPSRAQRVLQINDILYQTVRPYQKNNYFFEVEREIPTVASTGYAQIRTAENPYFFYELFHTPRFVSNVLLRCTGTSYPAVSGSDLNDIKVAYPNRIEQQKIAAFVQLLEKRIDAQRRLVEALKSYKRGVSTAIFTESLHIGSKSKWQEFSLGDFCTVVMGQSPDSTTYNSDGLGLPLVQGNADICEGITQPQHFTSAPTKIAAANSILLSVRAPVGSVSIANQTVCIGRGVCSITSENMDFLYQLLVHIQDKWKKIEQGGTFTAISGDDIRRFRVNIPCVSDQIIVGRFLGAIDSLINKNKAVFIALSKLKSAILRVLFI